MKIILIGSAQTEARTGHPDGIKQLAALGAVMRLENGKQLDDALLRQSDALVFFPWGAHGLEPLTAERLAAAPALKFIGGTFDNRFDGWLDFPAAETRGITVVDTSRYMTPTVGEYALALILCALRDIPQEHELVSSGGWTGEYQDEKGYVGGRLHGRRVGLAGFGVINRVLAGLLAPFECAVAACDPHVGNEVFNELAVRREDDLVSLAQHSEIFVVGIPPTPRTIGIINAEVIGALPRGAIFVLVTRAAVVEQPPLWKRVEAGEVKVAIDVYDPEPPPADSPIRRYPNVIHTPHSAGRTGQAHRGCFLATCHELGKFAGGNPLEYRVLRQQYAIYAGR